MKMLIAGGGTGGHLFPGIALAEELLTRQPNRNDVLFVGTARGIEARVVPQQGYKLELIDISGIKGMGLAQRLKSLWALPRAVLRSMKILRQYQPDVVVGVGGYASGPVALAAWILGVPTAIQEQNAAPGITNKVLSRVADVVFTAFPEAEHYFNKSKVQLLGNPIRRALLDNYLMNSAGSQEGFKLLVFGGSQGSRILNTTMLEAAPRLAKLGVPLRIRHQTGPREVERVAEGYRAAGVDAEVLEFITDMSGAYADAQAIVCRAGATTLAELTVARKAAVLIPFAQATDNHQEKNARSLVDAGAALMVLERDLSGGRLAAAIEEMMDPAKRQAMEKAAALLGRPEAAREILDVLTELIQRKQDHV